MTEIKIHKIDAQGKILGRLASQVADLLRGKNKPEFVPYHDKGDRVIVYNVDKLTFSGRKQQQKEYKWHSGYPGGLKTRPLYKQMEQDSTQVLRRAVLGMLPKNKLQKVFINKLEILKGDIKEDDK